MSQTPGILRRQFLRRALIALGAAPAAPHIVASAALGKDGQVAPSDRIILGAMGIGGRGSYDFGCMLREPDVRCVAVCDVQRERRERAKKMVDARNGDDQCAAYVDFREMFARPDIDAVLIATGCNWHGFGAILAARAGKDAYAEKPTTKTIAESLELAATFQRTARVFQGGMQRRSVAHFMYAMNIIHSGKLGKLHTLYAHPGGMTVGMSGWAPAEPEPSKEEVDWDLYLGTAAWRPFNRGLLRSGWSCFEEGGGLVGAGILPWGSHCVDLCQWAKQSDDTVPVEYHPPQGDQTTAVYADGVKLIVRNGGWMPNVGSCPMRAEGDKGWVEVGDSGEINVSNPEWLAARGQKTGGYPADSHIRDFFDCVKSRGLPRANHFVTCNSHIACHAVNIALLLKRKLTYDPKKHEFIGDEQANRLRSEALREPWRR
ncbi:MAG TPA: Gfo/Idh/MocA family oxidoreductase [Planctomycetota bacterium]|nr:Gfo/Idh/MocA family oxidoreductase [Planctomycetota bacterium]HRR81122.1 Gfo/Idh/MocA family oxidoreductase [Planctomycetota bacterium]HRT96099.1 Gfo/Idh/MocA family oxidoreductase [Planctomycetota bacterium]